MTSLRPNLRGFVVHQDADGTMEYGIETGMGHRPVPYCEWNFGTQCGTVILEWDEDAIVTNDVLIESVAGMNTDVARWLASLRLVLTQPKETILALAKTGIVDAQAEDETILVSLLPATRLSEVSELLRFYGWQPGSVGQGDRKFMFPG